MPIRPTRFSAAVLLGAVLSSTGCLVSGPDQPRFTVMRTGLVYPRRAPDCVIDFPSLRIEEAMARRLPQVGMITLTGGGATDFTPALREQVRATACSLGGEIVLFNAAMDLAPGHGMSQFFVFRARPEAPPP
ncbi:MAG TPA: hypothetical protein VGQ83_35915 [Polyangia bacterium]|jgi:hypothetical protein